MNAVRTLAAATYGEITRRPLYYILLLSFAIAILLSKTLTLFSFSQEMNLVREMGIGTIAFWAFIVVILSGISVTQELEDRTAVTLLSKPVRRSDFLLGKFFGITLALLPGIAVLAGVLLLTLWMMAKEHLPIDDVIVAQALEHGEGPFALTLRVTWREFLAPQGGVVAQGATLAFLEGAILAALSVSFAAFFPAVVAVATTTLVFVLGNISSYMLVSVEKLDVAPLTFLGRAFAYGVPNLGYFNLQTHFSEGRMASLKYLSGTAAYAALYVSVVFLVSCALFQKREVR